MRIPEKYRKNLSRFIGIYEAVENSHPGCGRLACFELLCDIADEALLVVASSGTGKSSVMKWLGNNVSRPKLLLDAVTVSGLGKLAKLLTASNHTILIDDLSKGGTSYSQLMTVTCLGELCYTGYIYKYTQSLQLEIEGFSGSVIMNAQPLILKRLLLAPEFETDIRDKVIRYYHIPRPVKPVLQPPSIKVNYGYGTNKIGIPKTVNGGHIWKDAINLFRYEFSAARAKEHLTKLSRACARFEGRDNVDTADVWFVRELARGFILENEIFIKRDLEGARVLDVNVLPLLSMISTYGVLTVDDIAFEFQVRKRRVYEILKENADYVFVKDNSIFLTDYGRNLLKAIGEH